jgi:hypothetical protein
MGSIYASSVSTSGSVISEMKERGEVEEIRVLK